MRLIYVICMSSLRIALDIKTTSQQSHGHGWGDAIIVWSAGRRSGDTASLF